MYPCYDEEAALTIGVEEDRRAARINERRVWRSLLNSNFWMSLIKNSKRREEEDGQKEPRT
jgi:hypothetical protein